MHEDTSNANLETATEKAPEAGATKRMSIPARVGAAGKALIAYLATGSLGVAIVVFIVFKVMGC